PIEAGRGRGCKCNAGGVQQVTDSSRIGSLWNSSEGLAPCMGLSNVQLDVFATVISAIPYLISIFLDGRSKKPNLSRGWEQEHDFGKQIATLRGLPNFY